MATNFYYLKSDIISPRVYIWMTVVM